MQGISKHIVSALQTVLALVIFYSGISVYGQQPINREAKKYFTKGYLIVTKQDFTNNKLQVAIDNLKTATEIDTEYSEGFYYLALAYYYNKNYPEADNVFGMYKGKVTEPLSDYYLFNGMNKYRLTDNNKAIENLSAFLNTMAADKDRVKDSTARRTLQLAKQSQSLMSKILPSKKEPVAEINTEMYDEYYPVLTSDKKKIYFNRLETDTATGKPINRIYEYFVNGDTTGPNPRLLKLNNIENREFILTSVNRTGNKLLLVSKDDKGLYDVYESEWMVREFTAPRKMFSQVNSYADDRFATFAHNDSLIYIISNRPGGYGGYDIWKINNTPRIMYESMINLGPTVNTEYDENYISSVPNSNVLFFCSEGHLNTGESDIFRIRLENGYYTRPVNLGYPINTIENNDVFFPYPGGNMGLSTVQNSTLDIVITYLPPKAKKPGYIMDEQYLDDARIGKTTPVLPKDE